MGKEIFDKETKEKIVEEIRQKLKDYVELKKQENAKDKPNRIKININKEK